MSSAVASATVRGARVKGSAPWEPRSTCMPGAQKRPRRYAVRRRPVGGNRWTSLPCQEYLRGV
eukprot:2259957-Alexandrium_andersonii.AAC.1